MPHALTHDGPAGGAALDSPVLDGLAVDGWGGEWMLGGPAMAVPQVPWSAPPDEAADGSDLAVVAPGPDLARRLAELDPHDVSEGDLVDLIVACQRLSSWADAVQVAAMAELSRRPVFHAHRGRDEHDELRSAGCEVSAALRLAPSTGETRVWEARRLVESFPLTLSALRAGEIDYRRATAISEVADRRDVQIANAVEQRVLSKAGERTMGQHRRAIERALLAVDPQGAEERHADAARGRAVAFTPMPDGMGQLVADLPADGMATVRAALDAAAAATKSATPGESRSLDQLRADALVSMARQSLSTGWLAGIEGGVRLATAQGRRPQIHVTVPFSTLIGLDEQPGELTGYGPIPPSVARRIAADGVWRRLLTDPTTGRLLDYGTTTYEPPADLRDFIIARDHTCIFPTCQQPAHRSQLDHTTRYPDGPTAASNLGPPCGPHHDLKTRRRWRLQQPEPGRFVWTTPAGKIYECEPNAIGPIIQPPGESPPADHDPPPF